MAFGVAAKPSETASSAPKSGAWADLGLTFPVFVVYHLAVVFLPVRNAADLVTRELTAMAEHDLLAYCSFTILFGAAFVGVLWVAGQKEQLRFDRFLWVGIEAVAYAIAMRLAGGYVIGKLALARGSHLLDRLPDVGGALAPVSSAAPLGSAFHGAPLAAPAVAPLVTLPALPSEVTAPVVDEVTGFVMSLGAGFYEELAFRVLLYGVGLKFVLFLFDVKSADSRVLIHLGWLLASSLAFSAWHHVGAMGDPVELRVLVFRWVCGAVFCLIYRFRGFAPVVWTHLVYDVWVLVL
jgi:hypothetical protein